MPTTYFGFDQLSGGDAAGYQSINALLTDIDSILNTRFGGIINTTNYSALGAGDAGKIIEWTGTAFATSLIDNANISSSAAIAYSKLALTGSIVNADINASAAIDKTKISGTAITAADTGTVTSTMIADGTIVNADVNAAAGIAKTKISGTAITAADTGTVTATILASSLDLSSKTVTLPNGIMIDGAVVSPATDDSAKVATTAFVQDALANAASGGVQITTSGIADNAITQAKMADNSVGTAEIINANVTADKLSLPTGGALTLIDSQTWTSSTTYTLPANAKICYVEMLGGAGGGGGGARKGTETTGNASLAFGGVGGAGGGLYIGWIKATDLGTPGNSISITIGAGGTGGNGRTGSSGDGTSGTDGGNTTIGNSIAALGGLGGVGGWWASNPTPASYFGTVNYYIDYYGWVYWGYGGNNAEGYNGYISGGGGGGGGYIEGVLAYNASAGGTTISETGWTSKNVFTSNALTRGGGGTAGSSGTTGGNGTSGTSLNGGGGGGYGTAGTGGNGGNGGLAAGGGGGGAAATANAGNGGSGGSGRIKLWVYG